MHVQILNLHQTGSECLLKFCRQIPTCLYQNHREGLLKLKMLGPATRVSDFAVVGWRICVSNKFQGTAGASGLALGPDFENHCPKISNPGVHGIVGILYKSSVDRGKGWVLLKLCPHAAVLLITVSQAL